jgi:hypothetical protein
MTQRYPNEYFPELLELRDAMRERLLHFFDTQLRDVFPDPDCISSLLLSVRPSLPRRCA